jgi:hypothetical protein
MVESDPETQRKEISKPVKEPIIEEAILEIENSKKPIEDNSVSTPETLEDPEVFDNICSAHKDPTDPIDPAKEEDDNKNSPLKGVVEELMDIPKSVASSDGDKRNICNQVTLTDNCIESLAANYNSTMPSVEINLVPKILHNVKKDQPIITKHSDIPINTTPADPIKPKQFRGHIQLHKNTRSDNISHNVPRQCHNHELYQSHSISKSCDSKEYLEISKRRQCFGAYLLRDKHCKKGPSHFCDKFDDV